MGLLNHIFKPSVTYNPSNKKFEVNVFGFIPNKSRNGPSNIIGNHNLDHIFISYSRTHFKFHRVFTYEVLNILDLLIHHPTRKIHARNLKIVKQEILKIIEENKILDIDTTLDLSRIKQTMSKEPFEHQLKALQAYTDYKHRTGYRGYLYDAGVGTGKTLLSLYIAEALEAEKVLIICPLPTLDKVWKSTIVTPGDSNGYKNPNDNKVWTTKSLGLYQDERFIILHYEAIERAFEFMPKLANSKTVIIVDESHNFADSKSKRTQRLIDVIDLSLTKNLILLSGTPVKSSSTEIINIARLIDADLKDPKLFHSLYKLYSSPNRFFKELLPNKYKNMSYYIEKKVVDLEPLVKTYIPIKIPNGEEYTIPKIRNKMETFILKRIEEIKTDMPKTKELFDLCLKIAEENGFNKKTRFTIKGYLELVDEIQKAYNKKALWTIPNVMKSATMIETEIKKFLPPELAKQWMEIKTIIKYPMLKIQGECLGQVILGARIACHRDMTIHLDFSELIDSTVKDTIIFSNYVEVCEAAKINVLNRRYKPVCVYANTTKNLTNEIHKFVNDESYNPLITTYKALSTGVPLTNANVIITLDLPFRMYLFEQAVGRAWRAGQDSQVVVYIPTLDTGDVPNINDRNFDIISFFNTEVENITGYKANVTLSSDQSVNDKLLEINTEHLYDLITSYLDPAIINQEEINRLLVW